MFEDCDIDRGPSKALARSQARRAHRVAIRGNLSDGWCPPIGIELDDGVIARVIAALGSARRPVAIDRARIERLKQLRTVLATTEDTAQDGVPAERAVAWLRALAETWTSADVPEAKADLLHAIYERIVVAGRSLVSARLTPAAYAHGLALALPEKVLVARPTGFKRGDAIHMRIPIVGAPGSRIASEAMRPQEPGTATERSRPPRQGPRRRAAPAHRP